MFFRPLPRFTLFCVLLLSVLLALGFWQLLVRLPWKLDLIAEMNAHIHEPAMPIDGILKLKPSDREYRHVALVGQYENQDEAYAYAAGDNGEPVYHVIVPFRLNDGGTLLVDRGIVPVALKDPQKRMAGVLEGPQQVTGVWRTPDRPGVFTPQPDLAQRVWYSRDVKGIAGALHLKLRAPVLVEADATPVPGGWPRGGQTVVQIPNDHLQYATTWFLLAAGLVVVYLAYHQAQGRLGTRRPGSRRQD